jgi:hypothetical protein
MLSASVAEYDIAEVRHLFGEHRRTRSTCGRLACRSVRSSFARLRGATGVLRETPAIVQGGHERFIRGVPAFQRRRHTDGPGAGS